MIVLYNFQDSLRYERILILQGELWRILSAHFVHLNLTHLSLNLAGWWIFILLSSSSFKPKRVSLAILSLALGISALMILFQPQLQWYLGFSGVLYGLLIISGVQLALNQESWLGLTLIGVISLKLAWDTYNNQAYSAELIGASVVLSAHWYGLFLGLIISLPSIYKKLK